MNFENMLFYSLSEELLQQENDGKQDVYTFRLLSENSKSLVDKFIISGIEINSYKKNPVLMYNHEQRFNDKATPIGKSLDVIKKDKQMLGKFVFDQDDEFALKIENKVRNGYLNAVSVGLRIYKQKQVGERDTIYGFKVGVYNFEKSSLFETSVTPVPRDNSAVRLNSGGDEVRFYSLDDIPMLLAEEYKSEQTSTESELATIQQFTKELKGE